MRILNIQDEQWKRNDYTKKL